MNINFHVLRHTFATVCVKYGVDTKVLSEMLGHSNIATTLNLYVHPTLDQKAEEMKKIDM
ncbi:MAG TPA: tyrosine-type recombinase/integrase [Candidatus Erysipelatoclostridium merdavium]|uniref:Tyrosine-type recombinase/integrase n=1 Tax=Candidatus Erysipelatoclostridium merdavium TaxID=2838566 RepID=A0A9D1XMC0_9FIRM|nr:tyrosine-type recombinase/integrase [Candidatus Erysipelatoclostridium merdavium]